jgi:hypothetical protein
MASELTPIDISQVPALARLVEEVEATGKPRRIRRGDRDVAIVMPATSSRRDTARDRRFRKMLAVAQGNPDVDGDALLEELEREDAERRAHAPA